MGIDRLDQPEIEFAQQLAVAIDLLQHGIEDQRLAAGAACQQIAVGSRNAVEQLTKDHGWRGLDLISDNTAYSSAMASSFETHRFAMLDEVSGPSWRGARQRRASRTMRPF